MSETRWTPGARTVENRHYGVSVIAEPMPGVSVSVGWFSTDGRYGPEGHYRISESEVEANAALYAAAPDLYEALEDVIELARGAMQLANRDGAEYDVTECLAEAVAALAEARGES